MRYYWCIYIYPLYPPIVGHVHGANHGFAMDSPCEGSLSTGSGNCPWTSEDLARELQNHRRPWKISCTAVTVGVAPCLPPGPAVSRSQFCCPLHTVLKVEDACCICHISSLLGHLFRPMTNFQERYYLRYLQLDTQLLQGLWNNDSEIVIHVGTISDKAAGVAQVVNQSQLWQGKPATVSAKSCRRPTWLDLLAIDQYM